MARGATGAIDVIDGGAWAALPGRWTLMLVSSRVSVAILCAGAGPQSHLRQLRTGIEDRANVEVEKCWSREPKMG